MDDAELQRIIETGEMTITQEMSVAEALRRYPQDRDRILGVASVRELERIWWLGE